jgi:hypothetical protein
MKKIKIILMSVAFLCLDSFAFDATRCMAMITDSASSEKLSSKSKLLNAQVSKISNQARLEDYYKDSNLLAPISMTASQAVMTSILFVEFLQLVKLNFLTINSDEARVTHNLLVSSINIFIKNNEAFLVVMNTSIDSSNSSKIRNYLEEVRTTIFEINHLLSACKN